MPFYGSVQLGVGFYFERQFFAVKPGQLCGRNIQVEAAVAFYARFVGFAADFYADLPHTLAVHAFAEHAFQFDNAADAGVGFGLGKFRTETVTDVADVYFCGGRTFYRIAAGGCKPNKMTTAPIT